MGVFKGPFGRCVPSLVDRSNEIIRFFVQEEEEEEEEEDYD